MLLLLLLLLQDYYLCVLHLVQFEFRMLQLYHFLIQLMSMADSKNLYMHLSLYQNLVLHLLRRLRKQDQLRLMLVDPTVVLI